MAEAGKQQGQTPARQERESRGMQRWDPLGGGFGNPFELMDRMSEEMDRMFERMTGGGFGFPRRFWQPRGVMGAAGRQGFWQPRVEAFQKGDRFIVRAELPGMTKDDVQVELTDEALTIRGERKEEREEEREGYFHSEREYGTFHRTIPLPDGTIGESAEATFRDGVLEIGMQCAPSEASRGRWRSRSRSSRRSRAA